MGFPLREYIEVMGQAPGWAQGLQAGVGAYGKQTELNALLEEKRLAREYAQRQLEEYQPITEERQTVMPGQMAVAGKNLSYDPNTGSFQGGMQLGTTPEKMMKERVPITFPVAVPGGKTVPIVATNKSTKDYATLEQKKQIAEMNTTIKKNWLDVNRDKVRGTLSKDILLRKIQTYGKTFDPKLLQSIYTDMGVPIDVITETGDPKGNFDWLIEAYKAIFINSGNSSATAATTKETDVEDPEGLFK